MNRPASILYKLPKIVRLVSFVIIMHLMVRIFSPYQFKIPFNYSSPHNKSELK
jgi:hypothetical protein